MTKLIFQYVDIIIQICDNCKCIGNVYIEGLVTHYHFYNLSTYVYVVMEVVGPGHDLWNNGHLLTAR